jgi:hypothetical protein
LFAGLSKHVDLQLVDRVELGSGAVAMRYVPSLMPSAPAAATPRQASGATTDVSRLLR